MKVLFDTNILIDYLNGIELAREEIQRHEDKRISAITWMEVMAGAKEDEIASVRAFLNRFEQVPVSAEVAENAVKIRREHRIKLPDAIIWASAKTEEALLVSRNTKDFPSDQPGVRIPYEI